MTHTKGPWSYTHGSVITEWRQQKGASLYHRFICNVKSLRADNDDDANGMLIAAAPELLAVCQDRLGQYESPATTLRAIAEAFDEKTPWSLFLRQKAAQMDNAIAKVEGEQ